MPRLLELREINGDLWARIGKPGEFPSGVSILTEEEINNIRRDECLLVMALMTDRREALRAKA